MKELPGENIFVVRYEPNSKDLVTASLRIMGFKDTHHDITGIPPTPWIFVDIDSKLYCTGKIGVVVAKPCYWHQITIAEFEVLYRLYKDGKDINSYIECLEERYRNLDWREFPLTDDPDYEIQMAQVSNWRNQLAKSMKEQTDIDGDYYVTDNQVAEVLGELDDRDVLYAIKNGKDPSILGAKYALRFRKFKNEEVMAFISEFRKLLLVEYKDYCKTNNNLFTDERYESLAKPCTSNLARIYLESGSTPKDLLEYLYLVFPINEWDFTLRKD